MVIFLNKKRELNRLLIGILLILVSLIIEVKSAGNAFGFKNIQRLVKRNSNIFDVSKLYNGYFGQFFVNKEEKVAAINLDFDLDFKYLNGYMVKTKQEGVVALVNGVVISNTEGETGKTVKIQGTDGIIYTYGFLDMVNVHIYQYVNANQVVGICHDSFYLEGYNDDYISLEEMFYEN